MDEVALFRRASDGFVARAQGIGANGWSGPTPCAEWDVRALVNHVTGEYLWMPDMLAGKTIAEVGDRFDGDVLGDTPLEAVTRAQSLAVEAALRPGAADATVHLSFGDTPAREYLTQMIVDSVIHSWDLARATGGDEHLDPELVEYAYADMQKNAETWRAGGAFQAAKQPVDESTQAKLIALTGR